jgi:O-antigen ligase
MLRWYYLTAGYFFYETIGGFSALDRVIFGEWEFKSGDKLTQALNTLAILAGFALFSRDFRKIRTFSTGACLLIALAAFLFLSSLWSIDPQVSARRGLLYIFFVIGLIGVASNLSGDEFLRLLGEVCFVAAVLSVGLMLVYPAIALMPDGALRGVFSHKSVLGQAMATGALLSLYRIRMGGGQKLLGIVMLAIFTMATFLARSTTSLLTIVALCVAEGIIALMRRGGASKFLGFGLILVVMPILVIGVAFPDPLLEILGKDPTLTGRSDLWGYVIQAITQKPILGWGLLAFWTSSNPLADAISDVLGWTVPQAHNGLLEILLEVGLIGTVFFMALLVRNFVLAVKCFRTLAREVAISLLLSVGALFLIGAAESVLVDPAQPVASVFFVTGLICEKTLWTARRQRLDVARQTAFVPARVYRGKSKVVRQK